MARDLTFGLTPFTEGGGYIEYVWDELSTNMQTAFRVALRSGHRDHLPLGQPRTMAALWRRGLVQDDSRRTLSARGREVIEWVESPDGREYRAHGRYLDKAGR